MNLIQFVSVQRKIMGMSRKTTVYWSIRENRALKKYK